MVNIIWIYDLCTIIIITTINITTKINAPIQKVFDTNRNIYMLDVFKGREEMADATNKLFETGFYLLNLGFALMILQFDLLKNLSIISRSLEL